MTVSTIKKKIKDETLFRKKIKRKIQKKIFKNEIHLPLMTKTAIANEFLK